MAGVSRLAWVGALLPDSGVALLPAPAGECAGARARAPAERATLRALLGGRRAAVLHLFDSL